jgi:hypothetical protein
MTGGGGYAFRNWLAGDDGDIVLVTVLADIPNQLMQFRQNGSQSAGDRTSGWTGTFAPGAEFLRGDPCDILAVAVYQDIATGADLTAQENALMALGGIA